MVIGSFPVGVVGLGESETPLAASACVLARTGDMERCDGEAVRVGETPRVNLRGVDASSESSVIDFVKRRGV